MLGLGSEAIVVVVALVVVVVIPTVPIVAAIPVPVAVAGVDTGAVDDVATKADSAEDAENADDEDAAGPALKWSKSPKPRISLSGFGLLPLAAPSKFSKLTAPSKFSKLTKFPTLTDADGTLSELSADITMGPGQQRKRGL